MRNGIETDSNKFTLLSNRRYDTMIGLIDAEAFDKKLNMEENKCDNIVDLMKRDIETSSKISIC